MSDPITTYGDINQRTAAWAAVEMLKHAGPVLVLQKFGLTKPVPKNKANTVKFRRAIPFSAATTPLQEGVTPSAQKITFEDVTAVIKQYGATSVISDVVMDMSEDPVLQENSALAGEQAALTFEMLTYGVIKAGTSVFYANGSSRGAVNTAISLNKQRAVTRYLKAQKAMKITSILSGSPNYATQPIEASYIAFGHTNLEHDIRALSGFVPTAKYGNRSVVSEHEIGVVEDVRYILSPELEPWVSIGGAPGSGFLSGDGNKADVYPVIYVGRDAYGLVPLSGSGSITPMVVNPKPSAADPLGQRGFVSWKGYFCAVILNQTWMSRLEVAVTAL